MIEGYLDELGAQLGRLGVRGGRRRRILAETEDHLRSDPVAMGRFGDPAEIAQAFADDLGTRGALRSPLWAFAALGVAGLFYTAMFVAWSGFGAANTAGAAQSASGACSPPACWCWPPRWLSSPARWRWCGHCGCVVGGRCRRQRCAPSDAAPRSRSASGW